MMNEDVMNARIAEVKADIENGNTEAFATKMLNYMEEVENSVRKDFEAFKNSNEVVLPKGYRACTNAEKKWLDAMTTIAQTKNAATSLTNLDVTIPETIINEVFEEIEVEHELVANIDLINTKNKVKWIFTGEKTGVAVWGDLCDAVQGEIKAGFVADEMSLQKLTAYMFVCLTILDLGYEWVMRYAVRVLAEAIAVALEEAIVNGTGSKMPIGMTKVIAAHGATQTIPATAKQAVTVAKLDAATLGSIASTLSNGGKRAVNEILMVVNPTDYFTKVLPAIAYKNALGEYVVRTPLPVKIVKSAAVAANSAVFGIGKMYKMALGLGEDGKLTYSDDFAFLDDLRTLKIKLVGNGRPMDDNSFVVGDITSLAADVFKVEQI